MCDISGTLIVHESDVSVTWKIPDFVSVHQARIMSSKFSYDSSDCLVRECWLSCYPHGYNEDAEGYVSLFFHSSSRAIMSFDIAIMNNKNMKRSVTKINSKKIGPNGRGLYKFIRRDKLQEQNLLPDGELRVSVNITEGGADIHLNHRRELGDHFKELFLSGDHSDVSILVGDREMQAHKCVLAARSPVFQKMFTHEMRENIENRVVISDLSEIVIRQMLEYIYTGDCSKPIKMPAELFIAADKYQLETLKVMCVSWLGETLTVDNACYRYLFSCLYDIETLSSEIEKFASENMEEIIKSANFEQLTEYPDILKKLLLSHFPCGEN